MKPLTVVTIAAPVLAAGIGASFADGPLTVGTPYEVPEATTCTKTDAPNPPSVIIGDGRPVPADQVVVPAHIDAAELTSAEWGIIPDQYLDSWLQFGGGHFLWKRTRQAPEGGELAPGAVSWLGPDDGGQDLPGQKTNAAVALYKYTIKSSTEKKKTVKRMVTATVNAEANGAWPNASVHAKVGASIDSESDFEHSVSEKVNIGIEIKCASFLVTPGQDTPASAILYFGPDTIKRDLPLPIKDAEGKPKVIKWNPIVLDAAFSADNAATGGNAIACWFSYKGQIEKGEVANASWDTKKGLGAEIGVSNGFKLWKFTTDISVEGKTANEWHNLDKTEFSKEAVGTWALTGKNDWRFPSPPTQKQRDDFQVPCEKNKDPAACAAWDNIKAAYMSEVIKENGVDGATEHGPNYRMIEWQNAMLTGSFRKVGDWLDSSAFFDLAELQQVGVECAIEGGALRVYESRLRPNIFYPMSGAVYGVPNNRCSPVDVVKPYDTTTKVGKIAVSVLEKANATRSDFPKILGRGYNCGHRNWDWDIKYPYTYWFYLEMVGAMMKNEPRKYASTDYGCWGCTKVGGVSCEY